MNSNLINKIDYDYLKNTGVNRGNNNEKQNVIKKEVYSKAMLDEAISDLKEQIY